MEMTPEDKQMSDAVDAAVIAFGKTAVSGRVPTKGAPGDHNDIYEAYENLKEVWKTWTYHKFFPEE